MSHQFTGLSEQSDCLSKIVTNHCVSGYTNNYPGPDRQSEMFKVHQQPRCAGQPRTVPNGIAAEINLLNVVLSRQL